MSQRPDQTSPRLSAALSITALVVAATAAAWGLTTGILQSPPANLVDKDPATGAISYILRRPLDPVGWLSWAGATRLFTKDPLVAAQAIQAATILGPADPQVLKARTLLAFQQGNVDAGLNQAADLAVTLPAERNDAFAMLRAHSANPEWTKFWNARLATGWPPVDAFLLYACQRGASLSTLFSLVQPALSIQPLNDAIVTCIGSQAINEGQLPAAYWLWVNAMRTTPKSLGNVFNGDFEHAVTGGLFDWRFAAGGEYREGFSVGLTREGSVGTRGTTPASNNNTVLSIRFNGRALKLPIAQQYLALQPGSYVLAYRSRQLGASLPGTVTWTVRCVPANLRPTIGTAKSEALPDGWTSRVVEVTVPDACTGQLLDLEAGDRLQLLQGFRGTVLFDDISMKRKS